MISLKQLLPQLIQIEEKLSRLFKNTSLIHGQYDRRLMTTALVLSRQMQEHASYYKTLKETLDPDEVQVEDSIYEFIGITLEKFREKVMKMEATNINQLYTYALSMYEESIGMMAAFQDQKLPDKARFILDELITNQRKNLQTLQAIEKTMTVGKPKATV